MVFGCISTHGTGNLHIWKGTINAERYIVLEQRMLSCVWMIDVVFQGRPYIFPQDNAKPHTASISTPWLHSRRVQVLHWPACSPDLSSVENIWKSWVTQHDMNGPLPKVQQPVSSVSSHLQTVVKRWGNATHDKKRRVAAIEFRLSCYFLWISQIFYCRHLKRFLMFYWE